MNRQEHLEAIICTLIIMAIAFLIGRGLGAILEKSELNKEQASQIESLIIASDKEIAIINKVSKGCLGAYQIETRSNDETTPMVASNQFVMPVLKYGIPGKEPEYSLDQQRKPPDTLSINGCYSQSI